MEKKRATTDLMAPNGSRDITFQSEDSEQDGHRHFIGFSALFLCKDDVTDTSYKIKRNSFAKF